MPPIANNLREKSVVEMTKLNVPKIRERQSDMGLYGYVASKKDETPAMYSNLPLGVSNKILVQNRDKNVPKLMAYDSGSYSGMPSHMIESRIDDSKDNDESLYSREPSHMLDSDHHLGK